MGDNNRDDKSDNKSDDSFWDKIRNSADFHIIDKSRKMLDDQISHVKNIVNSGKDTISEEVRALKSHLPTPPDTSVSAPFLWAGKVSREFSEQYPYIAGLCRRHPEVTIGVPSLLIAIPSYFGKYNTAPFANITSAAFGRKGFVRGGLTTGLISAAFTAFVATKWPSEVLF